MTKEVIVRRGGRITLPRQLRNDLGLTTGTCLSFSQLPDGTVILRIKHRKSLNVSGVVAEDEGGSSNAVGLHDSELQRSPVKAGQNR